MDDYAAKRAKRQSEKQAPQIQAPFVGEEEEKEEEPDPMQQTKHTGLKSIAEDELDLLATGEFGINKLPQAQVPSFMVSEVSASVAAQREEECEMSGEDFDSDELDGSMDSDEDPR
jgi:hypothetical protein